MAKLNDAAYKNCGKAVFLIVLIISPLLRGSVLPWHQTFLLIGINLIFVILLFEKFRTTKPALFTTCLDKPLFMLSGLVVLASLFSQEKNDSAEAIYLFLIYIGSFYATIYLIRNRYDQRQIVFVLGAIATMLAVIGLLKVGGVTPAFWHYPELDYPKAFVSGVYGNHNHLAGYLEMVIPLLLMSLLAQDWSIKTKLMLIFMLLVCLIAHIFTLSRGGWVALIAGMSFMVLVLFTKKNYKGKRLFIASFIVLAMFGVLVLSGANIFERALTVTDQSHVVGLGGRVLAWQGTLTMFQDHWILGSGPGTFSAVFPQYQPPGTSARFYFAHNDYLHYLAELGIVLVPLVIWSLVRLFKEAFAKIASSSKQRSGITIGATSGVVAMLFHSAVDFNLHIPANAILFMVLLALIVGGPRRKLS